MLVCPCTVRLLDTVTFVVEALESTVCPVTVSAEAVAVLSVVCPATVSPPVVDALPSVV